ncbi:hypothetical protein [Pelomonas sp. BJYL3]|uniref:hypothetical protein n=1 Tax=Pelomonas sp. BJYL3 TaxID=2976697 RepID=UPI0022B368EB|nr:hypothetical protein [Pelomonas sp. BJYL3]
MRRFFVLVLTLMVAAQLSWAGAALCCVGELAGKQGPADEGPVAMQLVVDTAHAGSPGEPSHACELGHCHCHHAGCATPALALAQPATAPAALPAPATAERHKSHIPSGLERPDWLRA